MKKRTHGGARKGAGRPPAENKVDEPVFFRLDAEQYAAAEKAARIAGFASVHAAAKHLLLRAIGATK